MKATRFMRRPFFVSGFQVTEEKMRAIAKWCEGHVIQGADGPFIRVPVDRAINRRQTEAHIGSWVLVSHSHGKKSFKVYNEPFLSDNFLQLPEEDIEVLDLLEPPSLTLVPASNA